MNRSTAVFPCFGHIVLIVLQRLTERVVKVEISGDDDGHDEFDG